MLAQQKPKWLILAVCIFVLLISFSYFVPVYGNICSKQDHTNQENCPIYHISTVIFWHLGELLNYYGGAINAVATAFIGWFTYTLNKTSREQARITDDALKLARDEFNATHRPKIILRSFQIREKEIPAGQNVEFIFIAHNIGESPGKIIEVRSATLILPDKEKIPNDLSLPFSERFNYALQSGQREVFPGNGGSAPTDEESMAVFAGAKVLLCLGIVVYLDDGGIRRETGFCRRYRSREDEWDTIKDSEYEYAY